MLDFPRSASWHAHPYLSVVNMYQCSLDFTKKRVEECRQSAEEQSQNSAVGDEASSENQIMRA